MQIYLKDFYRVFVPDTRIAMLKTNYEEMLARAMEEDRERASLYLLPRLTFYT
jgi:hypothetical protein